MMLLLSRPLSLLHSTLFSRSFLSRLLARSRRLSTSPISEPTPTPNALFQSALLRGSSKSDYHHHTLRIFHESQSALPSLPGSHTLCICSSSFDLRGFLKSRGYPVEVYEGEEGSFRETEYVEDEDGGEGEREGRYKLSDALQAGVISFEHEGTNFSVFIAPGHPKIHILTFTSPTPSPGRTLVRKVFEWESSLKDEVWVFSQGEWEKDKKMYRNIQKAGWEGLVLDEAIVQQLRTDSLTFFRSKEVYKTLHAPWKRGLILYGPPGNGKTQCIQALLKDLDQAGVGCIYVKTFSSQSGCEWSIRSIFEKARKQSPCVLVLEDLDSLLGDNVRSFFLNEMDGLENNDGILTIATTNHPERIDDAILLRPSRFDARFLFGLPTHALRERYCLTWIRKVQHLSVFSHPVDESALAKALAGQTAEWSYAFLKELFVSFLLRTASRQSGGAGERVSLEGLVEQVKLLSVQVTRGRTPGFRD